ncbi:MAG TPA: metalloregulator ArsR/SmtB family transcription factor [Caulobacteraceae bacterium]|nr:metalloregulator ArsR/SmtB family transcription factor [Caulobacteraceae bacterium]
MAADASAALAALGDPTRRTIFEALARRPMAVGEIAAAQPVSRPAVSQHLKVLKAAGLVTESAAGTRRIYRLDPRGIGAMRSKLDEWHGAALAAFAAFVEAENKKDRNQP